jgi:hypothetical protein
MRENRRSRLSRNGSRTDAMRRSEIVRKAGVRMGHARIRRTALSLLVFAAGSSCIVTVAAATSPTCQRFVETQVLAPVRNKVSKTTAAAWAKWRVGHPNWKPNPKVQRPKYVMTHKEAMEKVDFACEVPPAPPSLTDAMFPPENTGDMPPVVDTAVPPMTETAQLTIPDLVPPEAYQAPPVSANDTNNAQNWYVPGFMAPVWGGAPPVGGGHSGGTTTSTTPVVTPPAATPVAVAVTPEPASWILAASGMFGGWFLWMRRIRTQG